MAKNKPIKLKGVSRPKVQSQLQKLSQQQKLLDKIIVQEHVVSIRTPHEVVRIGTLRQSDAAFLQSLHEPVISGKITGGSWIIYNEDNKQIREVDHIEELPPHQQELINHDFWRAVKKNYGFNLEL